MEWQTDWKLRARMILAVIAVVAVAGAFAAVLFTVFRLLAAFLASGEAFPQSFVGPVAAATTLAFVAVFVAIEWVFGDSLVLQGAGIDTTTPEAYPELHRTVGWVAQQADLPAPIISVMETAAPHAFTVGYTQSGATMVVSTGLLDALDGDELTAVIAHELAHVKNRDVAVMMALSLPTIVAYSLMGWARRDMEQTNESSNGVAGALVFAFAGLFWAVGRLLLSLLSRYREVAADRGAVAITGSPADLASALSTLDGTSVSLPSEDVRSSASVAAFSIVPVEVFETDDGPVMLGPEGNRMPHLHNRMERFRAFATRVLRTHPDTSERIDRLKALQRSL